MNAMDHLRNFRGKPDADLGEKLIDGRPARGFRFSEGGWNNVVWIDAKTNLPVRMENKTVLNAEGVKTIVLTDFVFDAPLDETCSARRPRRATRPERTPSPGCGRACRERPGGFAR